jgi:HD superfamily phosphodiesterase
MNIFDEIWEKSKPYQDKRDDQGHAETVTNFAKELLKTEKGDEDIVIPAAILHDIGWSQIPVEKLKQLFLVQTGSEFDIQLRHIHQTEGVKLAKHILDEVNYPKDKQSEIIEIISQHDTRKGFLNANDGIMRDADKLWRFSEIGFAADIRRRKNTSAAEWVDHLRALIEGNKFYSKSARNIAERELKLRERELK